MNKATSQEVSLWTSPRETENLLGHQSAEDMLISAYSCGRFPHAWLISGPSGIGKATLAFRMARAMLSGTLDGPNPTLYVPTESPVFRRIAANSHGGLLTIERLINTSTGNMQSEIVIDSIRQLRPFFGQTSSESLKDWRIAIIDAAENMNSNAANALLKLLEEPPTRSVIFLISHVPGSLSPTLRSRCCELKLRPLSLYNTSCALKSLFPDLNDDEGRCLLLSHIGDGSIGRAAAFFTIDPALLENFFSLLVQLPDIDYAAVHALADQLSKVKRDHDYQSINDIVIWWLGRAIRIMASGAQMPEIMDGETNLILRLTGASRLDQWIEVWKKIGELYSDADRLYLNRKQVFLASFVCLADAARGMQRENRAR